MTAAPAAGPLDGYVVVDLSGGIAGAYCTKLLADAGADVVIVEDPGGHPLRRWSASGAAIADGEDGALFSFLSCSKESVCADGAGDDRCEPCSELLDSCRRGRVVARNAAGEPSVAVAPLDA